MATIIKSSLTVIAMILLLGYPLVNAKLLAMRPLSAQQVYRLLHESGRTDAVPQGRIITQGLAAMAGFALGLTKGLGTALIFDIITANVTDLDLGLAGSSTSGSTQTTQEVCFNTRNARSLEDAAAIAEAYTRDDDNKIDKSKIRKSEVDRRLTKKRRNKKKKLKLRRKQLNRLVIAKPKYDAAVIAAGRQTGGTAGTTGTATANTMPTSTASGTTSPITTATTATSPGTGTNSDNGGDTGTTSLSTTETGNEGAVNCIVIQKPTVRKR